MSQLISAPIRTGKTLFVVKKIFEELNKGRMVYTNIVGINIEGVISVSSTIDNPFDWRDLPNGSVLVWDEAHEHPAYSEQDLLKNLKLNEYEDRQFDERIENINNSDLIQTRKKQLIDKVNADRKLALIKKKEDILDIGRALLLHGHFGIEIYFITQRVTKLNADVLASVTTHFVLRRKFGMDAARVWEFGEAMTSWSKTTADSALNKFYWRYPKHLYKFYKSSENHQVRKSFPIKYAAFALIPIFLFAKGFMNAEHTGFFGLLGKSKNDQAQQAQLKSQSSVSAASPVSSPAASPVSSQAKFDVNFECRKAENLDRKECKEWFDQLTKNNQSVQAINNPQTNYSQSVSYNPNKPFDDKQILKTIQYNVVNQPKFSGCMKSKNGSYKAYTEQGTYLNVSQSDCLKLMKDSGNRPYDYFTSHSVSSSSSSFSSSTGEDSQKTLDSLPLDDKKSNVRVIEHHPTFSEKDITKPSI